MMRNLGAFGISASGKTIALIRFFEALRWSGEHVLEQGDEEIP